MKRKRASIARNDPARTKVIEAAIRHAEKVIQTSGKNEAVIFRPVPTKVRPPEWSAPTPAPAPARSPSTAGRKPINPTMALAVSNAFGLPTPAEPVRSNAARVDGPEKRRTDNLRKSSGLVVVTAAATVPTKAKSKSTSNPKKSKAERKKAAAVIQATISKKAKVRRLTRSVNVVVREPSRVSVDRRKGAAGNAASRLAINARIKITADDAATKPVSPFGELQRRWQAAFSYLQRFAENDPDAPDIMEAGRRLADVEREWTRLEELAPDHPDYFPWPSTDLPADGRGSIAGTWQEIGMLAYLGYHVGLSSTLNAQQRKRLLDRVFAMRLPPLNGVAYMRQWGTPDTATRLKKIAESQASFVRNAKRRKNPSLSESIRHWEEDLSGLRLAHYVGRFDFVWPAP